MMAEEVREKKQEKPVTKRNVDTSKAISEKYEQMIREQEEFLRNLEKEFPNLGVSSDFDLENTIRLMAMAENESSQGTEILSDQLRNRIREAAAATEKLNLEALKKASDNPHEDQASDGELSLKNQDADPVENIKKIEPEEEDRPDDDSGESRLLSEDMENIDIYTKEAEEACEQETEEAVSPEVLEDSTEMIIEPAALEDISEDAVVSEEQIAVDDIEEIRVDTLDTDSEEVRVEPLEGYPDDEVIEENTDVEFAGTAEIPAVCESCEEVMEDSEVIDLSDEIEELEKPYAEAAEEIAEAAEETAEEIRDNADEFAEAAVDEFSEETADLIDDVQYEQTGIEESTELADETRKQTIAGKFTGELPKVSSVFGPTDGIINAGYYDNQEIEEKYGLVYDENEKFDNTDTISDMDAIEEEPDYSSQLPFIGDEVESYEQVDDQISETAEKVARMAEDFDETNPDYVQPINAEKEEYAEIELEADEEPAEEPVVEEAAEAAGEPAAAEEPQIEEVTAEDIINPKKPEVEEVPFDNSELEELNRLIAEDDQAEEAQAEAGEEPEDTKEYFLEDFEDGDFKFKEEAEKLPTFNVEGDAEKFDVAARKELDEMSTQFSLEDAEDEKDQFSEIESIIRDVKTHNIEAGLRNDENTQVNVFKELNKIEEETREKEEAAAEVKKPRFFANFFSIADDDDDDFAINEEPEEEAEEPVDTDSIASAIANMKQYGLDDDEEPQYQPQPEESEDQPVKTVYVEDSRHIDELNEKLERERQKREELFEQTQQLKLQVSEYENELNNVNNTVSRTDRILNVVVTLLILALFVILLVIGYFFAQQRGLL